MRVVQKSHQRAMGISPSVWGPHMWKSIHYVCRSYPENPAHEDKVNYEAFLKSLPGVLPCMKCRMHLAAHMDADPPDAALERGAPALFEWSVALHNAVNDSLGKPRLTVAQANAELAPTPAKPNAAPLVVVLAIALFAFAGAALAALLVVAKKCR